MLQIPDPYIAFYNYQILRMAKAMYDYKKDSVKELSEIYVDSDFLYDTFWICLNCLFSKFRNHYSDGWEGEILFLRDTRIDVYFRLVREYGSLTGLKEDDNPHFKEAIRAIDNSLCYEDSMYDCCFRYNKKNYRACRILFVLFGEFCNYYEIVEGMISIIEFFEESTEKLHKEIENLKSLGAVA